MAQMTDWTDDRDGEHWILVIRHSEHPSTTASLEFTSKSERRAVVVTSDIPLDALPDLEIKDLLDRARIIHRFTG